ncbi:hypothetical protein [Rhizosaccharibacter radicis]|uniref:Uncharacterized protein n=1 Tax=Rhizosaccharibacter radicis TaxID=2782605 RepID=A0ABT1VYT8_9PROT|nr:hypothetical protein [Acetobacteraceae bacterium KSS12]
MIRQRVAFLAPAATMFILLGAAGTRAQTVPTTTDRSTTTPADARPDSTRAARAAAGENRSPDRAVPLRGAAANNRVEAIDHQLLHDEKDRPGLPGQSSARHPVTPGGARPPKR